MPSQRAECSNCDVCPLSAQPRIQSVLANCRLVGPVDRATLRLGSPNDLREGLVRPRLQCGLILLRSAPGRPLRRHAPAHQVFANGTDRHVGIKIGPDEFLNRTPRPNSKRQAMSHRPVLNDLLPQQCFIVTGQGAVSALHAVSPKGNYILCAELVTAQSVAPCPDHHGTKTDARIRPPSLKRCAWNRSNCRISSPRRRASDLIITEL